MKYQLEGGESMKKIWTLLSVLIGVLCLLSGCGASGASGGGVDPEAVELTLTHQPDIVMAGQEVELKAEFSGVTLTDGDSVTFDFRTGEEPELVEATYADGKFSSRYTFPEKGIQTIYVHLYTGDLHLTKKEWMEVQ